MAKGHGRNAFPGGGQMKGLMQQVQKMQREMEKAQEDAGKITADATVGGGAIKLTMNAEHQLQALSIDPAVVDPEDVEMLTDLIIAAVNEASRAVDAQVEARMSSVTGGMNLPFPGF